MISSFHDTDNLTYHGGGAIVVQERFRAGRFAEQHAQVYRELLT